MRLVTHNREVSSTSQQHQPAAPAGSTSRQHQPAAPAGSTSRQHQPTAPAGSTSWRDDSLATHSLTRDPQPRGLGTPPATAVPSRARPAHAGLHHEAPVAAALLLGPTRGRRRRPHALPRQRRRAALSSRASPSAGAIITRFLDGGGVGGLNAGDRLLAVNGKLVTDGAASLLRCGRAGGEH